jgi:hypothetical protein
MGGPGMPVPTTSAMDMTVASVRFPGFGIRHLVAVGVPLLGDLRSDLPASSNAVARPTGSLRRVGAFYRALRDPDGTSARTHGQLPGRSMARC